MSRCGKGIAALLVAFVPIAALAQSPAALVQKSYPVADLVVPLEHAAAIPGKDNRQDDVPMGVRIAALVAGTIEPTTWREGGGKGIVEYVPTTKMLVVSQTAAVQEKVAGFLADLRQSQDVMVEVEVRLLSVRDSWYERIGVDFESRRESEQRNHFAETRPTMSEADRKAVKALVMMTEPGDNVVQRLQQTFVDDRQLFAILEAAQGDRRTEITHAPKITVLNGQTGTIRDWEQSSNEIVTFAGVSSITPKSKPADIGIRVTTRPAVTPDRRVVNLYLKVEQAKLSPHAATKPGKGAPPATVLSREMEKTLAIPVGQTAVLLGGRRIVETREEFGPPALAKIPYVNRLFRNTGYGRESMLEFVLVTPRIVKLDGGCPEEKAAAKPEPQELGNLAPGMRITDSPTKAKVDEGRALLRELEPAAKRHADVVAVLKKAYLEARAAGRAEEAERLARALRAIDPKIQLQR